VVDWANGVCFACILLIVLKGGANSAETCLVRCVSEISVDDDEVRVQGLLVLSAYSQGLDGLCGIVGCRMCVGLSLCFQVICDSVALGNGKWVGCVHVFTIFLWGLGGRD